MPEAPSSSTVNLAIVRGAASGVPELRQLPSGRRLATFAVRTHGLSPPATSVPVAAWDPPAWLDSVEAGDELIIVGCLRRRFFRTAGGGLGSKVELEAAVVGRAGDPRPNRKARFVAEEALEQLG